MNISERLSRKLNRKPLKMCIIGCTKKLKLNDLITGIVDEVIDIDTIKKTRSYYIQSITLSSKEIKQIISKGYDKKVEEKISAYVRSKIKEIQFFMNDYLYQGCIILGRGKTQDEKLWERILIKAVNLSGIYYGREDIKVDKFPASLRPCSINLIKKGKFNEDPKITLHFVASHNRLMKSYFYDREDWIHIISPKLSIKFLKQNKDLKREDWKDGIKVFYFDDPEEIDEKFKIRLKKETKQTHPIAVLIKGKDTFMRIKEFSKNIKLNRMWVIQGSWI
jgi:hypothetical protein